MQGKAIIAIALAAFGSQAALAGDSVRRTQCQKVEQPQQRAQPAKQQRSKPRGCPVVRTIPPVVDPTPWFLL